jgi:hypothetical protein
MAELLDVLFDDCNLVRHPLIHLLSPSIDPTGIPMLTFNR